MPLLSFGSRGRNESSADCDTFSLPPPDMAAVRELVEKAKLRARATLGEGKNKEGEKKFVDPSPCALKHCMNSLMRRLGCTSTRLMDFVQAFVVTFITVYFTVAGYLLYRGPVRNSQGVL
ncbi:hypothetical protein TcCL_NonESM07823 [Trypanosoma cruzi]|nr:hypothetical protein TcCL_NonESM07823 [Trypanosoma cruzi]